MSGLLAGTLPASPFDSDGFRLSDDEIVRLGEGGVVLRDGLLGPSRALACSLALQELDASGALEPARLGKDKLLRPGLRGDRHAFLGELDLPGPLHVLWQAFERLRETANRDAWLGLRRFEVQLACYPGDGARYAAHRDAFAGDPARRLTAICYLNPDWRPEHGGQLVAQTPDGPLTVEPRLDRLVLFLSDRVLHEVLPSHSPRFAATAWYRGAEAIPLLPDAG